MQYRKLSDLKKLEGNPRIIRDKQFKTLCDSIRDNPKYFEARPLILSDRTGSLVIIAGNQRFEAAKFLKLKKAPTFLIEGLTEEKEREIIIRDNAHAGEWDFDALANQWGDLPLGEWGVKVPTDWSKENDDKKGLMRSNFMDGQGGQDDEDDNAEAGADGKYPVTFILDQSEWEQWETVKDRIKIKSDKAAFLKLIGGNHA